MSAKTFDLVNSIIEYENGTLDLQSVIELFAHLIKTGTAWTFQGSYGRAAANMIDAGIIARDGTILKNAEDLEDL